MPTFKLTGTEELLQKLKAMEDGVVEFMGVAVKAGGEEILAAMKTTVPVRTGQLKASLEIIPRQGSREWAGVRVGPSESGKRGYIARFLEFGTAKMPARPFMRPAFDMAKEAANEAIRQAMCAAVEEAVK